MYFGVWNLIYECTLLKSPWSGIRIQPRHSLLVVKCDQEGTVVERKKFIVYIIGLPDFTVHCRVNRRICLKRFTIWNFFSVQYTPFNEWNTKAIQNRLKYPGNEKKTSSFSAARHRATTNLLKVGRAERASRRLLSARQEGIRLATILVAGKRVVFSKRYHKRANLKPPAILSVAKSGRNRLEMGPTSVMLDPLVAGIHVAPWDKGKRHLNRAIVDFRLQWGQLNQRTKTLRHIPLLSLSPLILPTVGHYYKNIWNCSMPVRIYPTRCIVLIRATHPN